MLEPNDAHPISITPLAGEVTVRFGGATILTTRDALELREASYPPVLYLPCADAVMGYFEPSAKRTRCPYKGEASYFSLKTAQANAADAVWSYEAPYLAVEAIKDRLAFYPDKVEIEIARD